MQQQRLRKKIMNVSFSRIAVFLSAILAIATVSFLWVKEQEDKLFTADETKSFIVSKSVGEQWPSIRADLRDIGLSPGTSVIDLAGAPAFFELLGLNVLDFSEQQSEGSEVALSALQSDWLVTSGAKSTQENASLANAVGINLDLFRFAYSTFAIVKRDETKENSPLPLTIWQKKSAMVGPFETVESASPAPSITLSGKQLYDELEELASCDTPIDNLSLANPIPYFYPAGTQSSLIPPLDEVVFAVGYNPLPEGLELGTETGHLSGTFLNEAPLALYPVRMLKQRQGVLCVQQYYLYLGSYAVGEQNPGVNEHYRLSRVFGFERSDPRGFKIPYGSEYVVVDGQPSWVVTDCATHRFVFFDLNGSDLSYHGSLGSELGQFNTPADIKQLVDGGFLIVDELNDRIVRYGADLQAEGEFTSWNNGELELDHPLSISVASESEFFVSDYGAHRVLAFNADSPDLLWQYGKGSLDAPEASTGFDGLNGPYYSDFSVQDDALFVVDRSNNRVVRMDKSGTVESWFGFGKIRQADGSEFSSSIELDFPHEVAVGPEGLVFVADTNNHRIVVFNSDGVQQFTFGDEATMESTKTVALSPTGEVLVSNIAASVMFQVWEPIGTKTGGQQDDAQLELEAPPLITARLDQNVDPLVAGFSGTEVHYHYCRGCHRYTAAQAPITGKQADWQPRYNAHGLDGLFWNAINGYKNMPAMGGCDDCSEEQIREAVLHMLKASKVSRD